MSPVPITEWTLRRDHADVTCTRRETDRGIEVSVTFCGLPVAKCVTTTLAHALEWALSRRDSWLAAGYETASAAF